MQETAIHCHHSSNPISGEMKRIINVDKDVVGVLSNNIIEIELFSLRYIRFVISSWRFTLSEKIKKKYYVPTIARLGFLNNLWVSIVITFLFFKYKPSYYVEEWYLPKGIRYIRKYASKNTKLLLDVHGASPEEYKYLHGVESKALIAAEANAILNADYIVCQSEEMKQHIVRKYNIKDANVAVYRCSVDERIFKYSSEIRSQYRHLLGFDANDKIFVYSGGLHKWQKVDEALRCFANYHSRQRASKMLILTRDEKGVDLLLKELQLLEFAPFITVKSLQYTEVPLYLNACDVAFLIRDNDIMNIVASPTKLAEYLICGLPVISSSVAEKWVTKDGLKYIISIENESFDDELDSAFSIDKSSISSYASTVMSISADRESVNSFLHYHKLI